MVDDLPELIRNRTVSFLAEVDPPTGAICITDSGPNSALEVYALRPQGAVR